MAYFLDPELDALTRGNNRAPVGAASTAVLDRSQHRPNKFGKTCHSSGCGKWVAAGAGYLAKEDGAWVVYCRTCP